MRSVKSGLFSLLAAGFVVTAVVVGCAASETGDVDPTPETDGTGPTPLPESNPPGEVPKVDAGKKDAAKPDAAKDAGPPPPEPGDKCTKVDEVFEKVCGKCGKQKALCLADGSAGKVSDYGPCENEIGQCVIGSTQECGNCGTSTCSNSCNWGVCQNQPQNACAKGTTEYSTAGCGAGQYRKRECSQACQWGNFSTTCAEPQNANVLTINTTVNQQVTGSYSLIAGRTAKRQPTYTCGSSATLSTTTDHPYELIELRNPDTTKTATLNVTMSGAVAFYAAIAAYPTNLPPSSDAELRACSVADYGYYSTTSPTSSYWPDIYSMTIPPNGRALIRVQAYYSAVTAPTNQPTTGGFGLIVKTTAMN